MKRPSFLLLAALAVCSLAAAAQSYPTSDYQPYDPAQQQQYPQQTMPVQSQGPQQVIEIEPRSPEIIYVPTYDPYYVWGPPMYGYYPRLNYSYFGFGFGPGINFGFCFGGWGGWNTWGWGPNWY